MRCNRNLRGGPPPTLGPPGWSSSPGVESLAFGDLRRWPAEGY